MMEKELLTAIGAYNLVRAVMALAARRHNLSPRQLSFTFVLNVVNASWHRLQSAPDAEAYQREVFRLLDAAAEGFTPNEKSADRFREPPGIVVIRFQLARNPNELFKWHWAKAPAPQKRKPCGPRWDRRFVCQPGDPRDFFTASRAMATFFRSCGASPGDVTAMSRLTVPGKPFPGSYAHARRPLGVGITLFR